jgi:hypothetical protein
MIKNHQIVKSVLTLTIVIGVTACGDESPSSPSNPSPSGTSTALENASVCFNPDLYTVDTTYSTKYQANIVRENDFEVVEQTDFKGQPAIKVTDADGMQGFYSVDNVNKSVTFLGIIWNSFEYYGVPAGSGDTQRFDLNKGEIYDQTYTMRDNNNKETVIDKNITFDGFETLIVPAGTYKACKFTTTGTKTKHDGTKSNISSSEWIAVEYGITIKNDSEGELVAATINGLQI